ncbi:hypothetical protein EVAR_14983_1 [Eumeta japonica]|uniref:Uncharacterized protein n=1 Tax=Eumeta variegata TaxID=151549 RepID=A0A4C1X7X3_EUMVA|nr:hypothetical protein EVAR_14983_1 [Eumeta japonica]
MSISTNTAFNGFGETTRTRQRIKANVARYVNSKNKVPVVRAQAGRRRLHSRSSRNRFRFRVHFLSFSEETSPRRRRQFSNSGSALDYYPKSTIPIALEFIFQVYRFRFKVWGVLLVYYAPREKSHTFLFPWCQYDIFSYPSEKFALRPRYRGGKSHILFRRYSSQPGRECGTFGPDIENEKRTFRHVDDNAVDHLNAPLTARLMDDVRRRRRGLLAHLAIPTLSKELHHVKADRDSSVSPAWTPDGLFIFDVNRSHFRSLS